MFETPYRSLTSGQGLSRNRYPEGEPVRPSFHAAPLKEILRWSLKADPELGPIPKNLDSACMLGIVAETGASAGLDRFAWRNSPACPVPISQPFTCLCKSVPHKRYNLALSIRVNESASSAALRLKPQMKGAYEQVPRLARDGSPFVTA